MKPHLLLPALCLSVTLLSPGIRVLAESSESTTDPAKTLDDEGEFIGNVDYSQTAFSNNYLDSNGKSLNTTTSVVPKGLSVLNTLGDSTWSRAVSNMISVYAKQGTTPSVNMNIDTFDGLTYHYLCVTPTDDTIVQLDYAGNTPATLNNMVNGDLTNNGYWFVGSINGGFFTNNDAYPGYGYPTGAIRTNNQWQTWSNSSGETYKLISDHNGGFVTAYWTGPNMILSYNGWDRSIFNQWGQLGNWFGTITENNNYENALSGSYTLFADGVQTNLSPSNSNATSTYWNYTRSVTIFAQLSDNRYILLTTEGTCLGDDQIPLLNHVAEREGSSMKNALRLDGGGSTQLCFDQGLVKLNISKEASNTIASETENAIGTVTVLIDNLNIRKTASLNGGILGAASQSTYNVYESKVVDGFTWYRIRSNQWIAAKEGEWTSYKENAIVGTVQVHVEGLNIRSSASVVSASTGTCVSGQTYQVYETKVSGSYTWYRIGDNRWIAAKEGSWTTYIAK